MTKEFEILSLGAGELKKAIIAESHKQGHYLTGGFERSLVETEVDAGNEVALEGEAVFYAEYLEDGVPANKIPYGGAKTGAKSSKYIEALIGFFQLRGLSQADATRAAFATAKKQSKEGMPTAASARFSQNGKRIQQVIDAMNDSARTVDQIISDAFDVSIDNEYHKERSETL